MADDPDRAPTVLQLVKHLHHLFEALAVEAAEPLVDEQRVQVDAAALLADRVGQPEGQGQGGHERLAAGQGGGVADLSGPLVLNDQAQAEALIKQFETNMAADGVKGTPTIFVNGTNVGNPGYDDLKAAIEAELAN